MEPDLLGPPEATRESIVDLREELIAVVRDEDQGKATHLIELVEEFLDLKQISRVECDNAGWPVVITAAIVEDIVWRGLSVDIHRFLQFLDYFVQDLEPRRVVPAVDVDRVDLGVLLLETIHSELRDTGFSRASWTRYECGVGWIALAEWLKNIREVIYLGVPVDYLARH